MKNTILSIALGCGVLCLGIAQAQATTPGQHPQAGHMQVYGQAKPPLGFFQLCQQDPTECNTHRRGNDRMDLTQSRWDELVAINHHVNSSIIGVTDQDLYGTPEMWTYPERYGDCEDYVLVKRKMLIDRGWSPESLLITVVWDEKREGHAVLTVTTSHGDFVLDNKHDRIKRWQETGYIFEKRQGTMGAGQWVWLRPDRPGAMQTVSAMN